MEADTDPFRARFYSWDTMGSICKNGVAVVNSHDPMLPNDIEVCAEQSQDHRNMSLTT